MLHYKVHILVAQKILQGMGFKLPKLYRINQKLWKRNQFFTPSVSSFPSNQ